MVANDETYDENSSPELNYKEQYKEMKRKLRLLIYENEIFQQTLNTTQRKLLKASRDKSVLLDRLLQYERVEMSSSDDELTESSDEGECIKPEPKKRRDGVSINSASGSLKQSVSPQTSNFNQSKKRKPSTLKTSKSISMQPIPSSDMSSELISTPETSKPSNDQKSITNFSHHTLPSKIFNDNFSVNSKSNGVYDMDTSPNHISEDILNVDSIIK
ncbi:INO80 complex subunit E [Daktulosphaira vitifoliae]|uniref:INO80 complex subunit E n=1 Tax=Daktulosphaira vitifoliae TaxID=58002 RepID=UPI0021AA4CA6|nr:INO80 complex subunit E [Daktulosphaira vitifoliae]